ncbi:hypothetical protein D1007_53827 [Hordeum vulgare]|nr:hypothetical protein D1007_53827 [Hordeum vulgare]
MELGETREATREAIAVPADGDRGFASDDEIQEIYPQVTAASGEGDFCFAGGGSVQIGEGSRTDSAHRWWEVVFLASSSDFLGDRQGFIILHLSSLWTTIRDAKGDILADNAEGSKDTGPNGYPKQTTNTQQKQPNHSAGTGPSNSALHQDLRFGAFEPASAPAKIGSRAASSESSLPRFLGKTPRSNKGSVQSKSLLQPLSLEEYLAGSKGASSMLECVHVVPTPPSGVVPVISNNACMDGGIAAGLGSAPTCQPLLAVNPSQLMHVHEGDASALHAGATTLAMPEGAAATDGMMLCSESSTPRLDGPREYDPAAAAESSNGSSASTGGAELGSTLCTANPEDNFEDVVVSMDGPDFISKVSTEFAPIAASP